MNNKLNKTMEKLLEGNRRFIKGKTNVKLDDDEYIKGLSEGQAPVAAVLTCSDSRVVPEYIFDQKIGKLFVIRVAGNVFTTTVEESIEVAVEEFGVKTIVVMSHTNCGAVKLSLDNKQGKIYEQISCASNSDNQIAVEELVVQNSRYVAEKVKKRFAVEVYAANYELETKKVIML